MKVLVSDFEKNFIIENEHGKFHPIYTFDNFVFNEEFEEYEYVGLIVTKTAEEMYKEWLESKDKPTTPQLTEQDKKINALEEELLTSNLYITDMELKVLELEMKLEALLSS